MTQKEYFRKRYLEEYKPAFDALMKFYPLTVEDLPHEVWRDILHYEGLYKISNFGRVKSFQLGEEKILKPLLTAHGYLQVNLSKSGKQKHFRISRLVAEAFIPNPENLPEVDHVFGMKFDNSVWNLRWVTSSQNHKYAFETGAMQSGEEHYKAKLTHEKVEYIRDNPDGLSTYEFSEKFDVSLSTVRDAQLGKIYKNAGGQIRQEHGNRKLTDAQRTQIRGSYVKGSKEFGLVALGKKFGVGATTICRIIKEGQS